MGRKARLAAGATAVVVAGKGGGGIKRVAVGCLTMLLLGILILGGGLALLAWLGTSDGGGITGESEAWPCPPDAVQVDYAPATPQAVRERVESVIRASGRTVETTDDYAEREIRIVWAPWGDSYAGRGALRLHERPTREWLEAGLGERLTPCAAETADETSGASEGAAEEPPEGLVAAEDDEGGATSALPSLSWPWSGGWTATAWLGAALAAWWLMGPNAVRAAWSALQAGLWPVRLGWRRWQRRRYRRALRVGIVPAAWPERPTSGQRWHEDESAMRDRQRPRRQVAETEPARRAAMRALVREERLAGQFGPARLWRLIYRGPASPTDGVGAPESKGV